MRLLSRPSARLPRIWPGRRLRRRIAVVAALCLVLAGSGGAWWLVKSGTAAHLAASAAARIAAAATTAGFAVDSVQVVGRERTSRAALLEALGVERGTPILAVDLAAAKARIEALAWVRSVALERQLPDTLLVHLVERQPLAYWQRQGKLALIDREGKLVPTERLDAFGPLVVLVGEDAPQTGAALLDMIASEPALAPHVAAAVRVGGRRWNLKLDNGIDVELPERDADAAWHRLAGLARDERLLERALLAVDLRLADRLVLRLPPAPPAKKTKGGKAT